MRNVKVEKNLIYKDSQSSRHKLDIYYPANVSACSVLIFVHGGTWMNGSKEIYAPLGENFADKGVVTVVINYRLGDNSNFQEMVRDCATAVKWVYQNIENFNGDKNKIILSGHSAGGHLASLTALDRAYFEELTIVNPIKKLILIDAFGLNIGSFIRDHGTYYLQHIEKIFTRNPVMWEKASPVNYVADTEIPFLIYVGSSTYPFLKMDNEMFISKLKSSSNTEVEYQEIAGKSHIEMITQLEHKGNRLYDDIVGWIKKSKVSNGSYSTE